MDSREALRIIRENRTNYNLIAKEWDISRHQPSALKMELLKGIKKGYAVLDIGCGNGFMLPEVLRKGGRYVGLDVSDKLIKIAEKRYSAEIKKGAKFLTGDALKLPFKKASFGFIFSFAVLHHIPSAEKQLKFLSEVYRVLKKGGRAVIVNWNLLNSWPDDRFGVSKQLKKPAKGLSAGDVYIPWRATSAYKIKRFFHIFSKEELSALAKQSGFRRYRVTYHGRGGKLTKNGEEEGLTLRK